MTPYLIKKYPNRRLYDTQTSKYITLTDLKQMIVEGATVKVIDSNTEEDITRTILMQIIMEAEAAGKPIFNAVMLQQIIRFYGGTMQGMFARFLEDSLEMFSSQQSKLKDTLGTDPLTAMTKIAENNMKLWSDMQKSFFGKKGK
jgi:polyhydroxyalkanoate synthesis repressor PhaR